MLWLGLGILPPANADFVNEMADMVSVVSGDITKSLVKVISRNSTTWHNYIVLSRNYYKCILILNYMSEVFFQLIIPTNWKATQDCLGYLLVLWSHIPGSFPSLWAGCSEMCRVTVPGIGKQVSLHRYTVKLVGDIIFRIALKHMIKSENTGIPRAHGCGRKPAMIPLSCRGPSL